MEHREPCRDLVCDTKSIIKPLEYAKPHVAELRMSIETLGPAKCQKCPLYPWQDMPSTDDWLSEFLEQLPATPKAREGDSPPFC